MSKTKNLYKKIIWDFIKRENGKEKKQLHFVILRQTFTLLYLKTLYAQTDYNLMALDKKR